MVGVPPPKATCDIGSRMPMASATISASLRKADV
jgi:hypothetical protein